MSDIFVIHTAKKARRLIVDGKDNSMVKAMIEEFHTDKTNVKVITEDQDKVKFNTIKYNGFSFPEELLHEYCKENMEEGVPMSFWDNILFMIELAITAPGNTCRIWNINLALEANPSLLEATTPAFLPNSKTEEGDQMLWKDWSSNTELDDKVYLLTNKYSKLSMESIMALKEYGEDNSSYGIVFKSYKDVRDLKLKF